MGNLEPEPEQLQLMFGIPGLHLTLGCDDVVSNPDEPFMTKVLRPYGHLIDHLVSAMRVNGEGLKLQEFCEAAAPCRSLDLTVRCSSEVSVIIGALNPVAASLTRLSLTSTRGYVHHELAGVSSLSLLSQVTSLSLDNFDFYAEEPWIHLAGLTNLKQLSLQVAASGDPSPLSALSGLSSLELRSHEPGMQAALMQVVLVQGGLVIPATFSSLQPLSTLQQLTELVLLGEAFNATSLHGLAELSRLETLRLHAPMLRSLEGVSTGLISLTTEVPRQLDSLAGIENLQGLQELTVNGSGVTSLHPLAALGSLRSLCIGGKFTSIAGLDGNLCRCLHRLRLDFCKQLRQLSEIEGLTALQQLVIYVCGVTSLQPVGQLVGGLTHLRVEGCRLVEEEVLELPHIQPTAEVDIFSSNVKEVVMAGGLRRRIDH